MWAAGGDRALRGCWSAAVPLWCPSCAQRGLATLEENMGCAGYRSLNWRKKSIKDTHNCLPGFQL